MNQDSNTNQAPDNLPGIGDTPAQPLRRPAGAEQDLEASQEQELIKPGDQSPDFPSLDQQIAQEAHKATQDQAAEIPYTPGDTAEAAPPSILPVDNGQGFDDPASGLPSPAAGSGGEESLEDILQLNLGDELGSIEKESKNRGVIIKVAFAISALALIAALIFGVRFAYNRLIADTEVSTEDTDSDGAAVTPSVSEPDADIDNDGLTNQEEAELGTNYQVVDTDGDGYSDGSEVENGYNPNGPGRL